MAGRIDRALHSPWLVVVAVALAAAIALLVYEPRSSASTLDEVAVTVNPKRPNGSPWDFGGGRPDPEVVVEARDGTVIARCPQIRDSLDARCRPNVRIERTHSPLRIKAVDRDSSADDVIGELAIELPDVGSIDIRGTQGIAGVQLVLTGHDSAWNRLRPGAFAIGIGGAAALLVWFVGLRRWTAAAQGRSRFIGLFAGALVAAGAVLLFAKAAVAVALAAGAITLVSADARQRGRLPVFGTLIVLAALTVIVAPVAS